MPDLPPSADPLPSGSSAESQSTPALPASAPALDQPYYGASFGAAFVRFWTKYATFSGRSSRSEFWWWALAWVAIGLVAHLPVQLAGLQSRHSGPLPVIVTVASTLWLAGTIVPFAALCWRRLHDANLSGWWAAPFLAFDLVQWAIATFSGENLASPSLGTAPLSIVSMVMSVLGVAVAVLLLALTVRRSNPAGARFDVVRSRP